MKVMVVVEDSEEMRIIIHRVLSRDPRIEMADTAATAEAAIQAAAETQPDLVILDHFIDGDVLGLDAAPMIKAAAPDAKILVFSDFDLEVQAAKEPAVDRFLPKKRLNILLRTVQELLGLPVA